LSLPPAARSSCAAVADAVATNNKRMTVHAVSTLIESCIRHLDQASVAELHELMAELA
jgi:hypothetical protein